MCLTPVRLRNSPAAMRARLVMEDYERCRIHRDGLASIRRSFCQTFVCGSVRFVIANFLRQDPNARDGVICVVGEILFPTVIYLSNVQNAIFTRICSTTLHAIRRRLFLQGTSMSVCVLPFFVRRLRSRGLNETNYRFRLCFMDPFVVKRRQVSVVDVPRLGDQGLPKFFAR